MNRSGPCAETCLGRRACPGDGGVVHDQLCAGVVADPSGKPRVVYPGTRPDPLESSHGWYDLSVTVSGDGSWSRRYTGHLEDGRDSITG